MRSGCEVIHIDENVWEQMIVHAARHYPNEACGILAGPKGEHVVSVYHECKNVYDEMHARDPETYPRTCRKAYLIDGRQQQKVFDQVETDGLEVKSIVHSHTDHEAYFSEEDRTVAAPWGEPMYPGISYIVVSIYEGKFKEANEFVWSQENKDFYEYKLK